MKKRNKKHQPKPKAVPAMVARYIKPFEFELQEMVTVDAFKRGLADVQCLKKIEDYMNLILIANDLKPETANHQLADEWVTLVDSVFRRYFKTNSVGVNGLEREKLNTLVIAYQNYWLIHQANFYNTCLDELKAFYREREAIRPYKKETLVMGMAA